MDSVDRMNNDDEDNTYDRDDEGDDNYFNIIPVKLEEPDIAPATAEAIEAVTPCFSCMASIRMP